MKIGKKSYILMVLVLVFSLVLAIFFSNGREIRAEENSSSSTVGSTTDPGELLELPGLAETEEDLRNKEDVSVEEMEAFMAGTAYQSPQARANGKITGSMTSEEYQTLYAAQNDMQNEAWNQKYNFRPETNVVHVSTYTQFRDAFQSNAVSKIVLDTDIIHNVGVALRRTESIEIDGQGHLLQLMDGSINVDGLTSLANFGKAFSDVPVFHMHDLEIVNGPVNGIETAYTWGFVNGEGGDLGASGNPRRGLWRYRMGNIYTPYDKTRKTNNQKIRGRLIDANRAEISIWGHNTVVTAAENFYTGGITYEPNTYYKGEIAYYDYSTIWFIQAVGSYGDSGNSTGTMAFDIGAGSFVYLHNTNVGQAFPGVYEWCKDIIVGENATFNVNTPGAAVSFNLDDGGLTAEEGATVNLLSRSQGGIWPTAVIGFSNTTNYAPTTPKNLKYEFKSKTNVFIVGYSYRGAVGYNGATVGSQFILDNPESFDIRNSYADTNLNGFLGDVDNSRGSHQFIVKNSDISIWNSTTNIDGAPTYDYSDVNKFKVTNAVATGTVTSTNTDLASQYTRRGFKRISGMNSSPEVLWTDVTDADYTQRATVLIGYTAVGGSDPFDENGDAKTKPVYADGTRKAYVDYTDTLGNTYTGVSGNDGYILWNSTTDAARGNVFQLAGQEMKGTAYRATMVNGTLTPYRTGEEAITVVLDVTPPKPAELIGNKLTNATKQLLTENLEPNAKVFLSIDGGTATAAGTVGADGKWSYDLPSYLTIGQTVVIYLQDSAEQISAEVSAGLIKPSLPTTHKTDGNINPYPTAVTYSDATFDPAVKYTVVDVLPDKPNMKKTVKAYRNNIEVSDTQANDLLEYTLTAKNDKPTAVDTVWKEVVLTDELAADLLFTKETAEVRINGALAADADYSFDTDTRVLSVKVGDLASQESVTVTFKVKVATSAVGKTITNTGTATGNSLQEANFIPGPEDPAAERVKISASSEAVPNPGGDVFGVLTLVSAPDVIDFDIHEVTAQKTRVDNPIYTGDLIIQDNRAAQTRWTITVKLEKELTLEDGLTNPTLLGAIKYRSGNNEITLNNTAQPIVSHTNPDADEYNVTQEQWSATGDGFKLEVGAGKVKKLGEYQAELLWELGDTP